MLYICGGLPGTGKSTLSQRLASDLHAVHLRIDIIEQALREAGISPITEEGYIVAYRLAEHFLSSGMNVVADCVNGLEVTRAAWRDVAKRAGSPFIEIEFTCSDSEEHRRMIESRSTNISGLKLPSWQAVLTREYEPWQGEHLVIDTCGQTVEQSSTALRSALQFKEQNLPH